MPMVNKGNMLDLPLIIILLFGFAFMILLSNVILTEFRAVAVDTGMNVTHIDSGLTAIGALDAMFIFATIFLGIATFISAFFIRTHPIMFVMSFILLIIFTIISSFFTNAFTEIINIEPFATTVNSFPVLLAVMQNLPLIMTVMGVIVVIALYAKGGAGGDSV